MAVAIFNFPQLGIGQSSPHPCSQNTIYVTMASSVDLRLDSCRPLLTISGLTGSQTLDMPRLASAPCSNVSSDGTGMTVRDMVNAVDRRASWSRVNGILMLALSGPRNSNSDFIGNSNGPRMSLFFNFTLINPASFQDAPLVSFTAQIGYASDMQAVTAPFPGIVPRFTQTLNPAIFGIPERAQPLKIDQVVFMTKFIRQSSSYPCDRNLIAANISTNIPILCPMTRISITGLSNTLSQTGPISLLSSSPQFGAIGNWTSSTGSLEVSIQSAVDWISQTNYSIFFELISFKGRKWDAKLMHS